MIYVVGLLTISGQRKYVAFTSREAADAFARSVALAPGRAWIEGWQSASGRTHLPRLPESVVAGEIQRIDPRFALSIEDERRRDAALTLQDADAWRRTIASLIELVVKSCVDNELTVDQGRDLIDRTSIGCTMPARIQLLGTFAYLIGRVRRGAVKTRQSRPRYASCLRIAAADLIISLKENDPTQRVTPGISSRDAYDPSSPLIRKALEVLEVMQFFGATAPPAPVTIDQWVRARRKQKGENQPTGRPRAQR